MHDEGKQGVGRPGILAEYERNPAAALDEEQFWAKVQWLKREPHRG